MPPPEVDRWGDNMLSAVWAQLHQRRRKEPANLRVLEAAERVLGLEGGLLRPNDEVPQWEDIKDDWMAVEGKKGKLERDYWRWLSLQDSRPSSPEPRCALRRMESHA